MSRSGVRATRAVTASQAARKNGRKKSGDGNGLSMRRSSRHTTSAATVEPVKANGKLRSGRVRKMNMQPLRRKTSSGPGDPAVEAESNRKKPSCSICGKLMRGHGKRCDPAVAAAQAAEHADAAISRSRATASTLRGTHSSGRDATEITGSDSEVEPDPQRVENLHNDISQASFSMRSNSDEVESEDGAISTFTGDTNRDPENDDMEDVQFQSTYTPARTVRLGSHQGSSSDEAKTSPAPPSSTHRENNIDKTSKQEPRRAESSPFPPSTNSSPQLERRAKKDTASGLGSNAQLELSPPYRRAAAPPVDLSPHRSEAPPIAHASASHQDDAMHTPTRGAGDESDIERQTVQRRATRMVVRRLVADLTSGRVLSSEETDQLRSALDAYEGRKKPSVDHFLTVKDKLPTYYHQQTYKVPLDGGVKATPNGAVALPLFRHGEREPSTRTYAHIKKHRHERFNAFAQKGDAMAEAENDQIWVFAFAVPKSGAGELREWTSPAVRADAPNLSTHIRKAIFDYLNPHREQAVREREEREAAWRDQLAHMRAQTAASDSRVTLMQKEVEEMQRENKRLKRKLVKLPKVRRSE